MQNESEIQQPSKCLMESRELSFPRLIVVPLSCHEVDGVRKEKERLTAGAINTRRLSGNGPKVAKFLDR